MKTFTSSGITAPASVPQLMIEASFHHKRRIAAEDGNHQVADDVGHAMETIEVSHTSEVSGASKSILSLLPYLALANGIVQEVGAGAGNQHHDAHDEDPDQQLHLHDRDRARRAG